MSVLVYDIETCSKVNRQRLEHFPLVLKIEPVIGASLTLVAGNCEGNVRCLISFGINRKNSVIRVDPRGLNVHKKPAPQNIAIIDRPARVELNSIGKDAAVDPSRQAGEDQITFIVRCKQSRAVAAQGQCLAMGMWFSEREKTLFAGHLRRDFLSSR